MGSAQANKYLTAELPNRSTFPHVTQGILAIFLVVISIFRMSTARISSKHPTALQRGDETSHEEKRQIF